MTIRDLHFLVVEDDDFQRQLTVQMLHSLGVTAVSESSDGRQALELIRDLNSRPVDITLCDLKMPEMDGMEFMRHLAQEGHKGAIVITSALDGKLLSSVARMARMYGIRLLGTIEKPMVVGRIKEVLKQYRQPDESLQQTGAPMSFNADEIYDGICADQFEPFFQPKVDLKTGRLSGAEALARWIHPAHGVIGPGAFIPQLERSDSIDDLTFLILRKSAVACRTFLQRGYPLTISVNLSLRSLDKPGLADKITQLVRDAGVELEYFVLEITESAAMTDVAHALENLARLCMNGFALSIDDYGTGYSSMQQLTRIAFSELKIDQSFVKDFSDSPSMGVIVESSIDMARKLGMKSVAEGVETQQDWDTLNKIGADAAQGYYIAKPMDLAAFHHFIENYSVKPGSETTPTMPDQVEMNVLVVDDDDFTRGLVLSVLRNLGFTKLTDTNNAESAIKLLESSSFDVIITDVNMPGINGLEFVKRIRAGRTLAKRDTRIVVLTAFSQTEILGSALALDINGFLVKPITPAMIDEKLAKAVSEKLHLHPPLAYEAVRTSFQRLPGTDIRLPNAHRGASVPLPTHKERQSKPSGSESQISLQRLRPGMVLRENIHLPDGTMLLSAGHVFSELSINRIYDIRNLLKGNYVSVQEAPRAG